MLWSFISLVQSHKPFVTDHANSKQAATGGRPYNYFTLCLIARKSEVYLSCQ